MDRKRIGKTFFIPASGDRGYSNSRLHNVSSYGGYWSAAPGSATGGFLLYFFSSYVLPQYDRNRTYGFSVRPVQE